MMSLSQDAKYIFILSLILILVAYAAGTFRVIQILGSQLVNLIEVSQGVNPQTGNFRPYPAGSPG